MFFAGLIALSLNTAAQADDVIINPGNSPFTVPVTLLDGECLIITNGGDLSTSDLFGQTAVSGQGNNEILIEEGGNLFSEATIVGAAPGIVLDNGGTVTVNGTLTTDGTFLSGGVSFLNGVGGTVIVGPNGSITTLGATTSGGIFTDGGALNATVSGNVTTQGGASAGVVGGAGSNVSMNNGGSVDTNGIGSAGVQLGDGSTISLSGNSSVNTNAGVSTGIDVGNGSSVSLTGGSSVNATGAASSGITTGDGSSVNVDATSNVTSDLTGISVGDGSIVTVNGLVQTSAVTLASGISAGEGAMVTVGSNGTITTQGSLSAGIIVQEGSTVVNNGSIETQGLGSAGIAGFEGITPEDNVTVINNGVVLTNGDASPGVIVGDDSSLMNTGNIMALGGGSNGVSGGDNLMAVNSGAIQADNNGVQAGENATIMVFSGGSVVGGNDGLNLQNNATVLVGSGATVGGLDDGIDVTGDASVTNSGTVFGTDDGIDVDGNANVTNHGGVGGIDNGIVADQGSTINNTKNGNIQAENGRAILATGGGANSTTIHNEGAISSVNNEAIRTGNGADSLTDFFGNISNQNNEPVVNTRGGADVVTLTGSTITQGTGTGRSVFLFNGGDTLNIVGFGTFNALLDGGNGTDTLLLNLYLTEAQRASIFAQLGIAPGDPLPTDGTFTVGDKTYDYASFENATLQAVVLSLIGTPNQQAIGGAVSPTFQSNNVSDDFVLLQQAIIAVGPGGWPEIANNLSPQDIAEAFTDIGFNNATFFGQQLDRHFDTIFTDGFESGDSNAWSGVQFDASGLELLDPTQDTKLQRWDRRLASLGLGSGFASDVPGAAFGGLDLASDDPKYMVDDSKKMMEVPLYDPRRFGVWLAGQGILAEIDQADADLDDASYDSANVTVGLDYRITREWVVGALFNWGYTDAAIDGRGSRMEVNTYQGGLYSGWKSMDDGWFANGYVAGGASDYNQSRRIVAGSTINRTALSDPDGWQLTTGVNSGYLFNLDRSGTWTAGPIWGVQYTHLEMDGFNETGAQSLNLAVGDQDADSFRTSLGGKLQGRWQVSNDIALVPTITAEWLHEFLDDSRGITGAFNEPAAGSFIIDTRDPDRDYGLVGLGLDLHIGEAWSAFLSYDAQFNEEYLGHAIGGGARYEF
ncbi:MAG: autotransporter domain-containing protein [Verrucomicrobiota bacterium]